MPAVAERELATKPDLVEGTYLARGAGLMYIAQVNEAGWLGLEDCFVTSRPIEWISVNTALKRKYRLVRPAAD